jgi:hypothetical protein
MTRRVTLVAMLFLTACTTIQRHEAPSCSGPRRPANPYGSVLSPEAAPQAAPKSSAAPAGDCGRITP